MTVWFTADTHFWHEKIIWLGKGRPFASVEAMNEALIEKWNDRVARGDSVYHLGDFAFGNRGQKEAIIPRLNGQIHLIRGNHDGALDSLSGMFASYRPYHELKVGGQWIVLFHFPIHSWHKVGQGSIHLHGHCHGLLPDVGAPRMDVGVDVCGYAPISFEEVMELMAPRIGKWLPGDHHGRATS